ATTRGPGLGRREDGVVLVEHSGVGGAQRLRALARRGEVRAAALHLDVTARPLHYPPARIFFPSSADGSTLSPGTYSWFTMTPTPRLASTLVVPTHAP